MNKSILQFLEKDTQNLNSISANFFENPTDIAGFISGVGSVFIALTCNYIGEIFEELDTMIRNSELRKMNWEIVRREKRKLLTRFGEIEFQKTLFKNKRTGERTYLLDSLLELEPNTRMTEDAEAQLLKEASESSYKRAGEAASISDSVSKGTVKNKLHGLKFPSQTLKLQEKKEIKTLYIDADEDHVALQFFEKKGDTLPAKASGKRNGIQTKLIYVYEGIEKEAPKSKRHRLINPHYFSGVYEGKDNARLWEEVREYIDATYDVDKIENIYLNADGGGWIKIGKSKIPGIISVLDEHHLNNYLVKMTSHLFDSAQDGRVQLREVIKTGTKNEFKDICELLESCAEEESTLRRIQESAKYIESNWTAAKTRLKRTEGVVGSSTEAHVSHVLSSRMSSRPMGWSKKGADNMARLRAYLWNGGSILDLVRYQKCAWEEPHQKEDIISASQILQWERQQAKKIGEYGKYYEKMSASLAPQARKILAIREHILM